MNRFASLAAASLFALALTACGDKDEAGTAPEAVVAKAAATPTDAITESARLLKQGDLLAVVKLSVPPAEFERMKARWSDEAAREQPTEEERKQFAEMMAKLTAPDAETALMAEFEPHLAKYDAEMAAQMPLMVGMGRGFAVQAIQENKEFTPEQKVQATQTLDAIAKWLGETNFGDRERARRAVEVAVATAREVDLQTLEQVHALSFEQMLQKAGVAFVGIKDLLAVYGFGLDGIFDSVGAELVSEQGDTALVKVNYRMFEQPLSFQTEMTRVDGRWFGKDTVEQLTRELDEVEDAAEDATDAVDGDVDADADTEADAAPVEG